MRAVIAAPAERRDSTRTRPDTTPWAASATLRPGHEVALLNVGAGGVLIAAPVAVRPGSRVELHLRRGRERQAAVGRAVRCEVVSLAPLAYEAAIAWDVALPGGEHEPPTSVESAPAMGSG